jgi:hypothetical protein
LDRRLGELQSRSGRGGEEKNSHPLPGLEPAAIQPVAQRYTTELYTADNEDRSIIDKYGLLDTITSSQNTESTVAAKLNK